MNIEIIGSCGKRNGHHSITLSMNSAELRKLPNDLKTASECWVL